MSKVWSKQFEGLPCSNIFIGIGKERRIFDVLDGLIRLRSIIRDPGFEWARCDKPILCQVVEETDLLTEMLTFPRG